MGEIKRGKRKETIKLFLFVSIFLILMFATVGCSDSKEGSTKENAEEKIKNEKSEKEPLVENETPELTEEKEKTLIDIEKFLKDFCIGERVEPYSELIGAKDGFKYISESFAFEVYEYDMNSEQYKNIKNKMKLHIEDLDMDIDFSAINGKFVLFLDGENDKQENEKLIKKFNDF